MLRYFLAVIDTGNVTGAASQCDVSQPTLSAGIAKLERPLGHRLFLRTNRRVELTDPGTQFAVHARRIESEFNLAERSLRSVRPVLRCGVLATIPSASLLAGATRKVVLDHVRQLLGVAPPANTAAQAEPNCVRPSPCCGGHMVVVETFERQPRAPPPPAPLSGTQAS